MLSPQLFGRIARDARQDEHDPGEGRDAARGVAHERRRGRGRAGRSPSGTARRRRRRAATCGSTSVVSTWWLRRIGCETRNAMNAAASIEHERDRREHAAPSPTAPAAGAGRRRRSSGSGPVEYSPVITSTPSTPIASCARCQPPRLTSTGLKVARSSRAHLVPVRHLHGGDEDAETGHRRRTETSSAQRVERSDQSFVHSERTTPP